MNIYITYAEGCIFVPLQRIIKIKKTFNEVVDEFCDNIEKNGVSFITHIKNDNGMKVYMHSIILDNYRIDCVNKQLIECKEKQKELDSLYKKL